MRKMVMLLILVLAMGGALFWLMTTTQGSVLISMEEYVVQFSLWTGLLVTVLSLIVLRVTFKLIRSVYTPGRHLITGRHQRRRGRWRAQNNRGLLALTEGHWDLAEAELLQTADKMDAETGLISYLGAANAAAARGEIDIALSALEKAEGSGIANGLSIVLARVRMLLDNSRSKEALDQILTLHSEYKNNPSVLALLTQAYAANGEWQKLEQLLPDLSKNKAFDNQALLNYRVRICCSLLRDLSNKQLSSAERLVQINELWSRTKKSVKTIPEVVVQYVTVLNGLGEGDAAEAALRRAINKHYTKEYILLYGKLSSSDPMAQIVAAESWLKARPDDADLLLALGRLCKNNKLWGKGRDYLTASLNIVEQPQTCADLAEVLIDLGDELEGRRFLQRGLKTCLEPEITPAQELVN
jgi:HemY protein